MRELGLTVEAVARIAGVSRTVVTELRQGKVRARSPRVLANIARALRWTGGSIDQILVGDAPTPSLIPGERGDLVDERLEIRRETFERFGHDPEIERLEQEHFDRLAKKFLALSWNGRFELERLADELLDAEISRGHRGA